MGKLEQIKAIENGKGIQYLIDSAGKIFNNPMYMIDAHYNLIAYTDIPVDDPIWNDLITYGTFSIEVQELMAKEGTMEDISNSDKIVFWKREGLKYSKVSAHIFNRNNIWVGQISMYEYNSPFDKDIAELYEILADKISEEIRDYGYFTALPLAFYEDEINKLLNREIKNPLLYNPQAQILYNGFKDYLYVAVVSVPQKNITDKVHLNRLAYFKSMLQNRYPSFKYAIHSGYIVMIMSSEYRGFYDTRFFNSQKGLFERNNLFVGISYSFENLYELREYYDQAVTALNNCIERNSSQRVFLFEP